MMVSISAYGIETEKPLLNKRTAGGCVSPPAVAFLVNAYDIVHIADIGAVCGAYRYLRCKGHFAVSLRRRLLCVEYGHGCCTWVIHKSYGAFFFISTGELIRFTSTNRNLPSPL